MDPHFETVQGMQALTYVQFGAKQQRFCVMQCDKSLT